MAGWHHQVSRAAYIAGLRTEDGMVRDGARKTAIAAELELVAPPATPPPPDSPPAEPAPAGPAPLVALEVTVTVPTSGLLPRR